MADSAPRSPARGVPRFDVGHPAAKAALRLAVLALILLAWWAVGNDSAKLKFPTPLRVVERWWDLAVSGDLFSALLASNLAMVIGYLLAAVIGVALGATMASVRLFGNVLRSYLLILMVIPLIAVLPLVQAMLGLGLWTRVFVVFLFAVVYITLNTETGVRSVPLPLIEMGRSFGAGRLQLFRDVIFPGAAGEIAAGLRLGLGRAIVGMVIAELFLVSPGVGSLISFYKTRFDSGAVSAIVITLILEGVLVMQLTKYVRIGRKRRS